MPRSPTTGIFTRVSNSFSEPITGTVIDPTDAIELFNDYDSGLTFDDGEPLILIGSTSGVLTIKAPDTASGTLTFPAGTTDFQATGGTGQFVKQASAGAAFTVEAVPASELSGLGTGVATALGINVGSAGAVVVNGGALGTPSSGTLTNTTGLPISTGVSGLGTGVATALGVNVGSAGAVVVNGGALGTPSSGTLTNATGLPLAGLTAQAAYTIIGNFTGAPAALTATTIGALTQKVAPAATDLVMIQDQAASGQLKYAQVSAIAGAGAVGSLNGLTGALTWSVVIQTFTASGTYTPTSGMQFAIIECLGGGGAGGGTASSSGQNSGGGGGGSGGYSRKRVTAADVGASQTVTVGAGGTPGAAGANAGGAGGASAVGAVPLCVANGGSGGAGAASAVSGAGGAGGVAGTGDFTPTGARGNNGFGGGSATTIAGWGGNGASSLFGGGGAGANAGVSTNGGAATAYGAGGGGAESESTGGSRQGGAGSDGVVIITEYVIA